MNGDGQPGGIGALLAGIEDEHAGVLAYAGEGDGGRPLIGFVAVGKLPGEGVDVFDVGAGVKEGEGGIGAGIKLICIVIIRACWGI